MFFPTYINELEAFTVRMPSTYVEILLSVRPFTCGDVVKFLLEPREYERKGLTAETYAKTHTSQR